MDLPAVAAARCCHTADMRTKIDEAEHAARTAVDSALLGKGFTSVGSPSSSISVCQRGKVAKATAARTVSAIPAMLNNKGERQQRVPPEKANRKECTRT